MQYIYEPTDFFLFGMQECTKGHQFGSSGERNFGIRSQGMYTKVASSKGEQSHQKRR